MRDKIFSESAKAFSIPYEAWYAETSVREPMVKEFAVMLKELGYKDITERVRK